MATLTPLLVIATGPAGRADNVEPAENRVLGPQVSRAVIRDPLLAPGEAAPAADRPRVSDDLGQRRETLLEEAFALAVSRLGERPECRAMFAELGTDGIVRLATTSYRATTPSMERTVCRDAVAFTVVGSPQTRLCRSFARQPVRRAASDLLHEALHWAGLSEKPLDPDGLTPGQITRMVQERCGL